MQRFLRYTQTQNARKDVTLYEFKHQNSVDVVLVLCCSCLNFELLLFASISFQTLSMYFVDWFNFASVNTIMLTFNRNSRELNFVVYFKWTYHFILIQGEIYFTLTITAFVSWEMQQNLTIFFVSFPVKVTCEGYFLLKMQAAFYQLQFYQR